VTDLIYRECPAELEIRSAAQGGDGRTVHGIAVPYGLPMRIDSALTEQFERGAFASQLNAARRVKFMRNHAAHGGDVIGTTVMLREDSRGLYGEWKMSRTVRGDETLELLKDGALTDFSIGFREGNNRKMRDGTVARTRATLFEVAVVNEGAYGEHATAEGIRSAEFNEAMARLLEAQRLFASLPMLPPPA
jgi:HK97 family phage prohead protease